MNKYELTVIFKATLEEEARKAEFDKIVGFITKFGGTIDKVDEWGKRKLAYEIQKLNEGFYSFIFYTAPVETPAEVESRINIMESVLRYLNIRLEA